MKTLVVSDRHLEFHADGGRGFPRTLDPWGADAVGVAGDPCTVWVLDGALTSLCGRFAHVVFGRETTEYDGTDRDEVHGVLSEAEKDLPGFHWLRETAVTIGGVRFGGGIGCRPA